MNGSAGEAPVRPWVLVKVAVAAELLRHFELSDEAQPLVNGALAPQECFQCLMDGGCFHDAARFLAHGLPRREAVWWACLAARATLAGSKDPNQLAAVEAAERWALQPSAEHCLQARQLAERTAFKTAASWAAAAAWWSAGSMAEPGQPEVPPPPFLYAQAVASAVCLAAVLPDPLTAEQQYRHFLQRGLDLARGGKGEV